MPDTPRLLSSADAARIEFLIPDLDAALTFMNSADLLKDQEHVKQVQQHAQNAYETVLRLLPSVRPDEVQRKLIEEKLTELKRRLQSAE